MRTKPGWHGYWRNPGDAGLPMSVEWTLPPGWSVGPMRYPVPVKLLVAGIVNHVYEQRLCHPAAAEGAAGRDRIARRFPRRCAGSPAPTRSACPRAGAVSLSVPTGGMATPDAPLQRLAPRAAAPAGHARARSRSTGDKLRLAIPLPASADHRRALFLPRRRRPDRLCRAADLHPQGRHADRRTQAPPRRADRDQRRARARRRPRAGASRRARARSRGGPASALERRSCSPCSARWPAGCCST